MRLASIYHFPYGTITTEGMVHSHGRTLAAPLAVKNGEFDVVLGRNNHHGATNAIGLTAKERERHAYIIGGTGNGKTTMLQYAILQDIQNGKGVAVVDPHGDWAISHKELIEFVRYLYSDITVSIWSSNSRSVIEEVLTEYGLLGRFKTIANRSNVGMLKPNPEGFFKIHDDRTDLSNYLMIGNSDADQLAAAAAGIDFHLVTMPQFR